MVGIIKTFASRLCVTGVCLLLAACSGSGSVEPVPLESATGFIRIAVTDAPVDDVSVVNVQFTGVLLKPSSGDKIQIDFDMPKDIDLLTLTNGMTVELLSDTAVPVGQYNWVQLAVNAEFDNIFDSYAMTPTGQVELRVPSGDNNGLRLVSGFTISQNQVTDLVIDWDLRMALTDPIGQPGLHLRPALRVTDMAAYGTLRGTVAEDLVTAADCSNDLAAQTGNAVYVYEGTTDTPGDIGDELNGPFVTATVLQDNDGIYSYEISFMPIGEYTAAFTCQANDDGSDSDDDIVFSTPQSFLIEDGLTKDVSF